MKLPKAQIGVFGGSGFYNLLAKGQEYEIKTPYGKPSDKIFIGEFEGKKVAFLPRHGKHHQFPPHKIPYRANLYAFKMLGVNAIIAPIAAGSLQVKIKPGDFVLCDQFVNKTFGREDTYFEGNKTKNKFSPAAPGRGRAKAKVVHISSADPYCFDLRTFALKTARDLKINPHTLPQNILPTQNGLNNIHKSTWQDRGHSKGVGIKIHEKGTVVVINGPRFASKSESQYYQRQNWDVINMTQYPECILARELEMCYLGIALVTDYDAGLIGQKGAKPVNIEEVIKVFNNNNERVKKLIFEIIKRLPDIRVCGCHDSLKEAVIS